MGDWTKATVCRLHALNIYEILNQKDSLNYARTLNNLGLMYLSAGKHAKAEISFKQSISIIEKERGNSEDLCTFQHNLAKLYVEMGSVDNALRFAKKAIDTNYMLIDQVFTLAQICERMNYLENSKMYIETYMSLVLQHFYNNQHIINEAFEVILKRKSVGAEMLLGTATCDFKREVSISKLKFARIERDICPN